MTTLIFLGHWRKKASIMMIGIVAKDVKQGVGEIAENNIISCDQDTM